MSRQEDRPETRSKSADEEQSQVSLRLLSEAMEDIEPRMNLCVKRAYREEGKTTEQATAPCYQKAMKEWDERLNVNYHYLMKDLSQSPEIKQKVIEAERQWMSSRDEQFKAIELWELAGNLVDGSIPEKASIRGLDKKVRIVQNQAEAVFSLLADEAQGGDPYKWDKPL